MARRRRRAREDREAREMGRLVMALLALVVIVLGSWGVWQGRQASSAPAAASTGQIRIATWNLRTFSEKAAPDLANIARVIRESGFDLVALQEVQGRGQAAEQLRNRLDGPWRLRVSDMAGDGERFAYLYRSDRVDLTGEPRLLDGAEAAIHARRPYVAAFRSGGFDFALITVHASYANTKRRRDEIEAMSRYVEQFSAGAEKDILILGDFNEQKDRPNMRHFLARGWRPVNEEPTNLGSTEVYDNLLLNPRFTREWAGRSGVVRFDETMYGNNDRLAADDVSDHRPVWADFTTTGPDDDG